MIRYYNLKIGRRDVMGGVIRVDTSQEPDRILEAFYDDNDYRFRCVGSGEYDLIIPNIEFSSFPITDSGFRMNIPFPHETGVPTVLKIRIKDDGLELSRDSAEKAFLEEITEAEAAKLKEGKKCFDLMRAFVLE